MNLRSALQCLIALGCLGLLVELSTSNPWVVVIAGSALWIWFVSRDR